MSFHDKLAQKAIAKGDSSVEFSSAAQKHANATWFLVIIAAAVWYFFGWAWALIPFAIAVYTAIQSISATIIASRIETIKKSSESADTDFFDIVQAYGKILETSAPATGTVADVDKLPYPKHIIKEAIIKALRITDVPQLRENLKSGYILLSDWQENVGESNQGFDVSTLDMNHDVESIANRVLEQSEHFEKWTKIVQMEQEALKQELKTLGLW